MARRRCGRLLTSDFEHHGRKDAIFSLHQPILSAQCPAPTQRSQQSTKFITIRINELPCVKESELENVIARRFRRRQSTRPLHSLQTAFARVESTVA